MLKRLIGIIPLFLRLISKHPDANHNMGVLGVGFGKVQEALPFFKTALEVNATIVQYWLSYIDALIRLERFADAEALVRQAKSKGLGGEGFDQIEKNLNERKKPTSLGDIKPQDPPTAQVQPLITLYSQGQFQEVLNEAFANADDISRLGNFVQSYWRSKSKLRQIRKSNRGLQKSRFNQPWLC